MRHIGVSGYSAIVFRRNNTHIKKPGGLLDTSRVLYPLLGGTYRTIDMEWVFPVFDKSGKEKQPSKIHFGHLENENTVLDWQGSQICTLCVSGDTEIILEDASFKRAENILVGDTVQTLQGYQKITHANAFEKECVKIQSSERVQTHSTNHKILTPFGWISWDDLTLLFSKDWQPTLRHALGRCFLSDQKKCDALEAFDAWNKEGREHTSKQNLSSSYHFLSEVLISFLKDNQTYFSTSDHQLQGFELLQELSFPLMLYEPNPQLKQRAQVLSDEETFYEHIDALDQEFLRLQSDCYHIDKAYLLLTLHSKLEEVFVKTQEKGVLRLLDLLEIFLQLLLNQTLLCSSTPSWGRGYKSQYPHERELNYALLSSRLEDYKDDYSLCFDQYDEHAQSLLEACLSCLQQQDDVEKLSFPSLNTLDAKAHTQEHNRPYRIEYDHPYSYQALVSIRYCSISSCKFTPVGMKKVYDFTVENDNHYFTSAFTINKNCFDELTHFSRSQFFYMLSRNRSTCGVKPYVRATTNPDSESWVRNFIDWWIDEKTGLAIPERSGVIRWFIIRDDKEIWGDSPEEIKKQYPTALPKSFTFINASIYDNQILLKTNPEYLANLEALPRVEREKLLGGNWNVKAEAGAYFQKRYFEIVHKAPAQTKKVRYWDRAATKKTSENDPDWTVGIKAEKDADGVIYITDVVRFQDTALAVQKAIRNTAALDTVATKIGIEQDPGQAGKSEAEYLVRQLSGYVAKAYTVSKDKITRCLPASAQAEAGNIKLVEGKWNEDFLKELENFPSTAHDDQVDALSGAFLMLTETRYDISAMGNL